MKRKIKTETGRGVPAGRPGRRERRRVETREKLFRTALGLFAERGLNEATVEAITEAADVGKGTFFNYFPTKEHVLIALADMQLGKLAAAVAESRAGKAPTRDVLRRVLVNLYEEPGKNPGLIRALLMAAMGGGAVGALMGEKMMAGRSLLGEIFSMGQQRGEIRRDHPPMELARTMQQLGFGGMLLWALRPRGGLAEMVPAAFESFWMGVQSETARKGKKR